MHNPFKSIENFLVKIRDIWWNYPDLFLADSTARSYTSKIYKITIPYSHFLFSSIFVLILMLGSFRYSIIESSSNEELVEAVVAGVDSNGDLQKIDKINPIALSNIQLEKDIVDLVYEPLIRYEQLVNENNESTIFIEDVLVDERITWREGADYEFKLKEGVKWHDGVEFTADDVIRTFEINAQIDSPNANIQALKQLQWEKIGKYSVRVCIKVDFAEGQICGENSNDFIFPNFLELISVKIIPEHKSNDIDPNNINSKEPILFRDPVGTGKYKFEAIRDNEIVLVLNEEHHSLVDLIDVIDVDKIINKIKFRFYKDLDAAVDALQNGEVHTLATISSQYSDEIEKYPNINKLESSVNYTQFWGLYFNLRVNPNDGSAIGPEFFQDPVVRRAISSAINRSEIIADGLNNLGEEAVGPISEISYYFNPDAGWYTYEIERAKNLLEEAGWSIKEGDKYRTNENGDKLSFSLYFVENHDRRQVAEIIQKDLAEVGIEVIIDRNLQPGQPEVGEGWTLKELNEQVLAPRLFDVILYGVNTFIEPDRYELYHSSQQLHPGLNISGYVGSKETVRPRENRQEGESSTERIPKVDQLLESARSFDPKEKAEDRKKDYDEFQELLAEDASVVYLYHPKYTYYVSDSINGITLNHISSLENRFRDIYDWRL
ncbi:MAG: ABC transporter substrate-binding protein [Candidatus Dojkabacteria bacterium]|nr:ABC transporter substrate-binding protein [Candidatus Dojkabacteria bacterium]MDQ7021149.1 ABC transporter substrate-binding protein [Candidatus Dojkabacteria bacterium]